MRRQFILVAVLVTSGLAGTVGCQPQQPFYFTRKGNMDHYVGVAQQIEYPDLEAESLDEVNQAKPPLTLTNPKPDSYWDLSLQETMQIALSNATVLKSFGALPVGPTKVLSTPERLVQGAAMTIHTPAIAESHPLYGVEGALAAFDAQFSSSLFWEKNITPQNTAGFLARIRPTTYQQDAATFQSQIAKTTATGGQFAIRHDIRYEMNNLATFDPFGDPDNPLYNPNGVKRWRNDWTVDLQAEFRQPLLRGAGVGFNRIAGPGALPGQANGVILARLRVDENLADFEAAVRNMVNDVERAYWYLYFQYRRLDAAIAGRDATLRTWQEIKVKFDVKTVGAAVEAQAREQYFRFEAEVQNAQSDLYRAENRLRYLMGLAHTDGRLIRPAEEPTRAKVEFDWYDAHAEALTRLPELRKQKWVIKQREMELIAAKNYLLPRLDAVGRYGWTGLGDDLIDPSRALELVNPADPDAGLRPHSAYGSLTTGRFPSWHLGLDLSFPFGFRREMAGVRHAQLNLIRERKVLQEQELEVSHQLAEAFRDLVNTYEQSQTQYDRWLAAQKEVASYEAAIEAGTLTVGSDLHLRAIQKRAEAEISYYGAVVDYTVAITQLHFRKGSLLEYNGVYLAEGPWPAKAYFDARRRARHRDASHLINYGFTQPRIVSQGPYAQHAGAWEAEGSSTAEGPAPAEPTEPAKQPEVSEPEPIQTPKPVPMEHPQEPAAKPESKAESAPKPEPGSDQAAESVLRIVPTTTGDQNEKGGRKGFDLAGMDLQGLASKPARSQGPWRQASPPVEATSFDQPTPGPVINAPANAPTKAATNWKATTLSGPGHESLPNPAPAPADPPPSGWKTLQHRSPRSGL